jgi:hypothetical protein
MIGSDGILIAADQRMVIEANNDNEFDDIMSGPKIVHLPECGTVYTCAGDGLSKRIAIAIANALATKTFNFSRIESSLHTIALKAIHDNLREAQWPMIYRSLMIAFYGTEVTEPQLWSLRMSNAPIDRIVPVATRVTGIAIGGAIGNSARFFQEYFEPNSAVSRLKQLAAHIVLTAERVDSLMIHGLDIATIDHCGFNVLNEDEKDMLRNASKDLDALIRDRLLGNLFTGQVLNRVADSELKLNQP